MVRKVKCWSGRINRLKFFARKHEELSKFRDGLGSSIFIDVEDKEDYEFLRNVDSVCRFLENKMMGK